MDDLDLGDDRVVERVVGRRELGNWGIGGFNGG